MEGMGIVTYWSDKRVLVTGASGMVGSWVTRALVDKGAYVVVLIRDADPQSELFRSKTIQKTNVVSGMLEDISVLERAINEHETDTVIHLGAQTIVGTALRSPLQTFEANIRGTYNLLEATRRFPSIVKRVVVASSDKAYGDSRVLPYVETMPVNGKHPYDVSKSCTDLLAQTYAHTYGLPVAIARCGNIFGGGDLNWSRIVPGTIRSLLKGERPVIRSNGKFIRDYVYVQDVVESYLLLGRELESKRLAGQAFNFSLESQVSVVDVVSAIGKIMGCDIKPLVMDSVKAEIQDQYLSAEKARLTLGWRPQHTLEEGLTATIAWYRSFFADSSAKPQSDAVTKKG